MGKVDIAALNRNSWSRQGAQAELRPDGFIDAGERAAFLSVAPRVRGQPRRAWGCPGLTARLAAVYRMTRSQFTNVN